MSSASGAAPAAAVGAPSSSRVEQQTTASEELMLTVTEPPRPMNRSRAIVEASYSVELREHCRAVAGPYATDAEFIQLLFLYFGEYAAEPLL